tara:strand:- start:198 stop:341 length:144 start_codon:yes stop_codon:yes gene_type:complete
MSPLGLQHIDPSKITVSTDSKGNKMTTIAPLSQEEKDKRYKEWLKNN